VSDSLRPHRRQTTRLPHPWDSPGKNTGVGCHFLLQCMKVKSESEVAQLCPTLCDPMDCSLPGSSIHGIFQARVLEWGAIAFSEHSCSSPKSSAPRDCSCAPLWKADGAKWLGHRPDHVISPLNEMCTSSSTFYCHLPFNSLLSLLFLPNWPMLSSPCSVVQQGPGARQSNNSDAST